MCNLLGHIPKPARTRVSALARTIFAQLAQDKTRAERRRVTARREERFPKAEALLAEAQEDIIAYTGFPAEF